ncbi:Retrovirus-related Pol polyprotein [Thelohanellus kitauei]|nr:Retrovirus-related Pol polyprotein [Thelohanellus kitauei]
MGDLKGYTDNPIKTLGKTQVQVNLPGKQENLPVVVTIKDDEPILGLDWMLKLGIGIQINHLTLDNDRKCSDSELSNTLKEYDTIFVENNKGVKNYKAKISLRSDASPKIFRARKVPYALKKQIELELNTLVKQEILEKVQDISAPVCWASPTVNIEKSNGRIRICGDFKVSLNKYINYLPYPLPTFNDILNKIKGGRYFSIIDLKDAYLQIPLDEESSSLTTISTHMGFFKYRRLPFGISSAPSIFQQFMDRVLEDIEGAACYIDDIIITGATQDEHLKNLRKVLSKLKEYNITTRKEKCKFLTKEVRFLGHIIDEYGIRR